MVKVRVIANLRETTTKLPLMFPSQSDRDGGFHCRIAERDVLTQNHRQYHIEIRSMSLDSAR